MYECVLETGKDREKRQTSGRMSIVCARRMQNDPASILFQFSVCMCKISKKF